MNTMHTTQIAVIGAGNMGSGIAQKYATHGYLVFLVDQNEQNLAKSKSSIISTLEQGVRKGVFNESTAKGIFDAITFTNDLTCSKKAELVIEAIFEELSLKQELFKKLEGICSKKTILATNTSSFRIADLHQNLKYPERLLGLHYFYHPAKNRLVELIGTKATDPDALMQAKHIQETINKIVIESKDSPGFIVNRFFVPWLNEAMHIVTEGIATVATVDAAAKNFFKIGMGPFELMNVTGLPITYHSCNTLASSFGDFYRPCSLIASHLEAKKNFDLSGNVDATQTTAIGMRLLSVVSSISCQLALSEQVCSMADVDLGARVGLLWQKGPFELSNEYLQQLPLALATEKKARNSFFASTFLDDHLKKQQAFPSPNVLIEKRGSFGVIRFNKPDTLNALDLALKNDLAFAFSKLLADETIEGIVITGHKRAFMAGADLSFFNAHIKEGRVENVVAFAQEAQDLFLAIDQCPKPIVAAVDGMALGGGLELALACDAVVATNNARFAFPETGIGIYPGLGGTQRTPRRIGVPLARYLILTGAMVSGAEAKSMGLIDEIADESELLAKACALIMSLKSKKTIVAEYSDFDDLKSAFSYETPTMPLSERAQKAMDRLAKKAPLAVKLADSLIKQSSQKSLALGLAMETKELSFIFRTKDAAIGLQSALTKERVIFSGQ